MKIKTQSGKTIDMGGWNTPIEIRDLKLAGGGGPFAVVAFCNEINGDQRPEILGVYSDRWMAENAFELIPDGIFDDDNGATFRMPLESESIKAAWDITKDYIQESRGLNYENEMVDCLPRLADMNERRVEILAADYLNGQDDSDETRKRQNAITNAFNCGVLSFFYWLSDRHFLKNSDEIHDLLLSNCTGLFDRVTRGKI